MRFSIDYAALGALSTWLLIFLLGFHFLSRRPSPSLAFSRLKELQAFSWRSRLHALPKRLHLAALALFMLAFLDPRVFLAASSSGTGQGGTGGMWREGAAIYLVLDQSGSMAQTVALEGAGRSQGERSKIDLLKEVTTQFILDHPSDLLGLVSFARVPRVLVPLTLDRKALIQQLKQIQPVVDPDQDGTAMGYAIFKTASLMAATRHFAEHPLGDIPPPYTIKGAAMIVVTDGFQNPSRLDQGNRLRTIELDEAATYAKSQNVHLYVVNIDPRMATEAYAPQRRQLESAAAETGGHLYLINGAGELKGVYADIARLEKGTITQATAVQKTPSEASYTAFPLYSFCIVLGLGFLFIALLFDSLYLRTVP